MRMLDFLTKWRAKKLVFPKNCSPRMMELEGEQKQHVAEFERDGGAEAGGRRQKSKSHPFVARDSSPKDASTSASSDARNDRSATASHARADIQRNALNVSSSRRSITCAAPDGSCLTSHHACAKPVAFYRHQARHMAFSDQRHWRKQHEHRHHFRQLFQTNTQTHIQRERDLQTSRRICTHRDPHAHALLSFRPIDPNRPRSLPPASTRGLLILFARYTFEWSPAVPQKTAERVARMDTPNVRRGGALHTTIAAAFLCRFFHSNC